METNNKTGAYKLQPGEELPREMLDKLKAINHKQTIKSDHNKYVQEIEQLFNVKPIKVTEESKLFLAGFLEGEASTNVSVKKLANAKYGVLVDPEFSITQHVNGVSTLHLALNILHTGRIRHKAGSNATFVLIIDNRVSLEEKVLPFYDKYVKPFGSEPKTLRLTKVKTLLARFKAGAHTTASGLIDEILPIWDSMRMQRGQINEAFPDLATAQQYVRDICIKKGIK